jgi:hypothetical protein
MSDENLDRSNPAKFVKYMKENPFYFKDIFYLPFTPENANKALKEMGFYGFVGTIPEPKKPTVHRKRIEKKAKTEEISNTNVTIN